MPNLAAQPRMSLMLGTLVFAIVACSGVPSTSEPTATLAPTAEPTTPPSATPDLASTAQAEQASTEAAQAQSTQEALIRRTNSAATAEARRVAGTATAIVQATAQAEDMFQAVEQLKTDGFLTSTAGQYHVVPDFLESWAQLNYYSFWDTDYTPSNFVIRAKTSWESGSDRADWWNSGCGFVFRSDGENNHYLAYLALDGYVYFSGFRNNSYFELNRGYYGKVETQQGKAEVMLVADGNKFTYFVNDQHVISVVDNRFTDGTLALTLVSGTNKSFGTRCRMIDIELWQLEE